MGAGFTMNDPDLRVALKDRLARDGAIGPKTLVIDELGLRHGRARVDVAVVNGSIHGFELKTAKDSLARLPIQIKIYTEVLDQITLVVADRHLEKTTQLVPSWCGLYVASFSMGKIELTEIRKSKPNPLQDSRALAKLLWRDEALRILRRRNKAHGLEKLPRRYLYERLALCTSLEQMRKYVRTQLKARTGWRSGAQ